MTYQYLNLSGYNSGYIVILKNRSASLEKLAILMPWKWEAPMLEISNTEKSRIRKKFVDIGECQYS